LEAVPLHIVDPLQSLELGPFHIDYIGLTHSIAEPNALAVRCGGARVLHTGDWKIDPDPVIGKVTEYERLKAFGDEGVDAIVCDSTNVLSEGRSGSEADVATALNKVVAESTGRVVVTTFASNIARLSSIAKAAVENGRHICLAGRGMHRIYNAARATGYLADFPAPVEEEDAAYLPPDKLVILCTGSQGEYRAALGRMAHGHHPHLVLEAGDRVVFSSKMIPGNETEILALQNQLAAINVEIITPYNNDLHVSGHPHRDELVDMYGWVRPRAAVPVHGECRHLIAHAALAAELGVPEPLRVHNGDMVQLYPGPARVLETVPSGRLYLDGEIFTQSDALAVRERRKLSHNGVVFVSIPLDGANRLCGRVEVQMRGIPEHDGDMDLVNWALDAAERALPSSGKVTPARAEEEVGQFIRRELGQRWGKKPMVVVSFVHV
ncbi:MAG: ribonuclease J, partial [Pseudomonadota bacterium]|nr:ribonuclease J [Pseudomonadota bacterium]